LKLKGEKMDNLKSLTQKESINLSDIALEKFEIYRKLILEWNEKINLTAITDEDAMNTKHFLDCLLLTKTGFFDDDKTVLDVGTGAGFPAIPLKLYNENLKVTMLDSLNKRIKFLNIVIDDLNLKDIKAIHGRAEEVGRKEGFRESFDIVSSRAVASLSLLLEFTIPFLKVNGLFLAMKGPSYLEEVEDSKNALKKLNCKLEKVVNFKIEQNGEISERNILIIKKTGKTPDNFPRNMGQIKKKPL
jgi:16S rRNA methyltransferase gidB